MERMKIVFLYIMILIGFFIYSTVMSNWTVKSLTEEITNIEVLTESPIIAVDNCEAGKFRGNINGTIRNNTGKHIEKIFLKIDLYDYKDTYIGTQYEEIKYFNVNELFKFDTTFKFEDVKAVKLSVVHEEEQIKEISNQSSEWSFGDVMTEENLGIALPVVGGMLLFIIL